MVLPAMRRVVQEELAGAYQLYLEEGLEEDLEKSRGRARHASKASHVPPQGPT